MLCVLDVSVGVRTCPCAGDQTGHIRVWDLTASACSCELVPEIGTPVRSLTVALDGTMIVAANNNGTCYVWRMMRGMHITCVFGERGGGGRCVGVGLLGVGGNVMWGRV
eukprot:325656-Pelagomonas_calceolata.AAC.3